MKNFSWYSRVSTNTWTWGWHVTTVPIQYSKIPLIQQPTIWKSWQSIIGGGESQNTMLFTRKMCHQWKRHTMLFTRKMCHQWKRHISGTCLKRPPRASVDQLLWYLQTPWLLIHQLIQLWRLQKTQNRTLITLNQQKKEMNQVQSSSNHLYNPSVGAVTKHYLQEHRSV